MSGEAQPTQPVPAKAAEQLAQRYATLIMQVRDRRKTWDDIKLRNHAAWHARSTGREQYKSEMFNHYIPVVRRAAERFIVRATQTLLPTPKFFEVFPGDEYDVAMGRSADSVRAFHHYNMTQRLKIRRLVNQLLRTLFLYEQAIVKTGVRLTDAPVQFGMYSGQLREVWPHSRAVDPFSFYVWPETVTDIEDALLVFEDIMMPYQEYEGFAQRKVAQPIIQRELGKPEWPRHLTERLQHLGMADPDDANTGQGNGTGSGERADEQLQRPENFVALTELWPKIGGRFYQMWLAWNVPKGPRLVRFNAAPYPVPPYRKGTMRPLPSEHYTSGMMDDLEPLQILYNDQVNQTEEARAITSVPPIIIDPSLVGRGDSIKFGPRQRWYVSPEGVQIPKIPDTSVNGLRAQQHTLTLINSLGGAGPTTEGQPQRGLPRAGFAVTSLISLAMGEIKDGGEIIEQDVLTPMLMDTHRWTMAFVPPTQLMRIPGTSAFPDPRTMTLNDLAGGWHFQWVGTLQSQDQQVRAQRLLAAIQQLGAVEAQLQMQGWMINWPDLLKMAWRDGLGERGVEQIVVPMPPEMRMQMMLQQLGAAGGAGGGSGKPSTGAKGKAPSGPEQAARQVSRVLGESQLGELLGGGGGGNE